MPNIWKRLLIGQPLKTAQSSEERLTKKIALAVFSSDALSSVAYGTEEILFVLVLAGAGALHYSLYVGIGITFLLAVLIISYSQTIKAYPSGGGAYIVARENLGVLPSLVAGAGLLLGYILTVSVSVAAGVAAITSAFPVLIPQRVLIGISAIAFIMFANLRGIRASGRTFAAPTYLFIFGLTATIIVGIYRHLTGDLPPLPPRESSGVVEALTLYLLMRAFSAGCTALTGVEAISNGVQAFRKPESVNARKTLVAMGFILGFMFLGITVLAQWLHVTPVIGETVVSQIARSVFGTSWLYYYIQVVTCAILLLAANTSFADFPRVTFFMARDKFLPIQLVNQGDRLVYSNGIILLAGISSFLIAIFGGDTHRLMPLYALGVFMSFTLSQAGMVRHWLSDRSGHWVRNLIVNSIGTVVTATVLVIIAVTKFSSGAWAIMVAVPLIVLTCFGINRHYREFRTKMTLSQELETPIPTEHIAVLFVGQIHKGTVAAARYAKTLHATEVRAIHVGLDEQDAADIRLKWDKWGMDIPLIITPSPYRNVTDILIHYIRGIEGKHPQAAITVIVPEFIVSRWWQLLLHNRTAARIKNELLKEKIAVASVPIQMV